MFEIHKTEICTIHRVVEICDYGLDNHSYSNTSVCTLRATFVWIYNQTMSISNGLVR